jgi:hypothetical protein
VDVDSLLAEVGAIVTSGLLAANGDRRIAWVDSQAFRHQDACRTPHRIGRGGGPAPLGEKNEERWAEAPIKDNAMKWAALVLLLFVPTAAWCEDAAYPAEEIYDTEVFGDEALVNVVLAAHRWPDCTTNRTAIQDIFRLEGAKSDEEKAIALWKWFRLLVSATGAYAYEGEIPGREQLVYDPHKIFTVYGAHQCDGMSWSMVPLWRAAGYIAYDECHLGHTIASLRYRDADGQFRFHDLDPQRRYIHWDSRYNRIGTWSMPLMRGLVQRHLVAPQRVHTLRTSLRLGETLVRKWDGDGFVIAWDRPPQRIDLGNQAPAYFRFRPGRRDGIYAAAGEESQTLDVDTTPQHFAEALFRGSQNFACSGAAGRALLHPRKEGETAEFIYRIASPYVAVEGSCDATLEKGDPADLCRISLSRDGIRWRTIYEKKETGREAVTIDLGRAARARGRPHVYTAYTFFVKVELSSALRASGVGIRGLKIAARRQLNKRTLPNLLPGENILRISADKINAGQALELEVRYRVDGKPVSVTRRTSHFPHYFRIDVPGVAPRVLKNYDQDFNNGALEMESIRLALVPPFTGEDVSLPEAEALAKFHESSSNPLLAELVNKKEVEAYESDVMQVSGFFPQSRAVWTDREQYTKLVERFNTGEIVERWVAAEDLGNYPEAIDLLCKALPDADSDLTLFIVKALAQLKDKKAVAPLLEKWERAPEGAPGTRYIPDALAAIGDARVVTALVNPLKLCRFDYRSHIAYALGVLGGPAAEETLRDLVTNDPFPAVREQAAEALEKLRGRRADR